MSDLDSRNRHDKRYVDPDLIGIISMIGAVLGTVETLKRLGPMVRWQASKRHQSVKKALDLLRGSLQDARAALRLISSSLPEDLADLPEDAVGIAIPSTELPMLERGLTQLHSAIGSMNKQTLSLESRTADMGEEAQRFYRVSQEGLRSLELLRKAVAGDYGELHNLIREVEEYLGRASALLE